MTVEREDLKACEETSLQRGGKCNATLPEAMSSPFLVSF